MLFIALADTSTYYAPNTVSLGSYVNMIQLCSKKAAVEDMMAEIQWRKEEYEELQGAKNQCVMQRVEKLMGR